MNQRVATVLLYCFVASIPLDQIPVEGLGSPSVVVGVVAAFAAVLGVVRRGRLRRLTAIHLLLIGFVLWGTLSIAWAVDSDQGPQRALTFAQLLALMWVVWEGGREVDSAQNMAVAFLVGALVAAAATVYVYWRGATFGLTVERYAGLAYDPNDLSVTLAIGLVFAWFVFSTCTGLRRASALLYVPFALLAVMLSGSRTGALAALTALAIVPLSTRRLRAPARAFTVLFIVISAAVLAQYAPEAAWERLGTTHEEILSGTMSDRTSIWKAGLALLADNWLIGVGVGSFAAAVRPYLGIAVVAHNTPLEVAAELGVPGIVLFSAAWGVVVHRARRIEPNARRIVWFLIATWCVGAMSLSWEFRKYTWFVLAFACQLLSVSEPARAPRARALEPFDLGHPLPSRPEGRA